MFDTFMLPLIFKFLSMPKFESVLNADGVNWKETPSMVFEGKEQVSSKPVVLDRFPNIKYVYLQSINNNEFLL